MRIAQQYEELNILRRELEIRLQNLDFPRIKELVLWLTKSRSFQKLKTRDNQMIMLDCFTAIWLEEKKQLEKYGVQDDIFKDIQSLFDIERKYSLIKYSALRLENEMPEQFCEEAVDALIQEHITGIAIGKIIVFETSKRQSNITKMADWLCRKGQVVTAVTLLQYGAEIFKGNREILLKLAECWLEGQQWGQAYECLKQIESPSEEDRFLLQELEQVIR